MAGGRAHRCGLRVEFHESLGPRLPAVRSIAWLDRCTFFCALSSLVVTGQKGRALLCAWNRPLCSDGVPRTTVGIRTAARRDRHGMLCETLSLSNGVRPLLAANSIGNRTGS
jgi:hypothetical protein